MPTEPTAFDKLTPYFQTLVMHCGYNPLYRVHDTIEKARDNLLAATECENFDKNRLHFAIKELRNTCIVAEAREMMEAKGETHNP